MWLLPVLSAICSLAGRLFYRLSVDGSPVPREGPVLLVANHPNSLIDPLIVAAVAGRPVRFLAKAPLFSDPKLGWIMRAAGAIPVYRRQDDPSLVGQNRDVFQAVFTELAGGAAIGIFPEGTSHSEPSLVELRTGAARMAMGSYEDTGETFPIIPVGLVPERKERFRSRMKVVLGDPIPWDDLAERGRGDREAVRELTDRIGGGLRSVTLNVERWEDRPLVETVEAIWSLRMGEAEGPAHQVQRFDITTRILAAVRRSQEDRWKALSTDLAAHARRLALFRLRPADLHADVRLRSSLGWSARRLYLVAVPTVTIALVGHVAFWVPFQLTALLAGKARPALDRESTYKLLIGIMAYAAWVLAVALVGVLVWGVWIGVALLVLLPPLGTVGLWVRERWRMAFRDVHRFRILRSRKRVVRKLRSEQERLGVELEVLFEAWESGELPSHPDSEP